MRLVVMPQKARKLHDEAFTGFIGNALAELVVAETNTDIRDYYSFLLEEHNKKSFAIIDPSEMEALTRLSDGKINVLGIGESVRGIGSKLYSAIDYALFTNQGAEWNSHKFIDMLNLGACPYCNAVSIRPSSAYPALDHFFPHARYPYLGLSVYNLLPVCPRCNSRSGKGSKYLDLSSYANPYVDDMHKQVAFQDKLRRIEDWAATLSDEALAICVKPKDGVMRATQARAFVEKIKVLDAYNIDHRDVVQDIVEKARRYSDAALEFQDKQYPGLLEYINPLYFNRRILSEEDISQQPLAKVRIDLCKQYHIHGRKKMKILHICAGWEMWNGAANIARLIMGEQQREGHEVVFATWASIRQLRSADEVWIHCGWMPCLWWAALWGRNLHWVPEACYDPVRLKYHGWKKWLVGPIERFCLRHCKALVATCEAEREWIRAYLGKRCPPIEVTDIKRFFNLPNSEAGALPKDRPLHLLYLGRKHRLKGLEYLEEAVKGIEGVELRVVSSAFGEEKEKVWDWCDVLVLPTLSDNFGLVIAEALERGKRVITTDGAPAWGDGLTGLTGFTGVYSGYDGRLIYLKGYRDGTPQERVQLLKCAIASLVSGLTSK